MITADDLFTEEYDESNDLERIEEPGEYDEPTERKSGDEEEEADEENESETKTVVQPKRRVVRNPQPKLNAETLKGKRGLAALESYFERVKFKGKGHEEQDLNVLLKTYEYWCHRLFPKYPFDDCIAKIETLGTKKPVQTLIKRIRLGMLLEDTPLAPEDQNASDNEEEPRVAETEDIFTPLQVSTSQSNQVRLSEAQLEQIRLNREKAEKIRQEKLARIRKGAETSLGESSRLPESHSSHVQLPASPNSQKEAFSAVEDETIESFDITENLRENPPEEEIESLLDKIEENQNSSLEEK